MRLAYWLKRRGVFVALFVGLFAVGLPAQAMAMPFLIPVVIAGIAYAAGAIGLTAFLVTVATAAISFVAQTLLAPQQKGGADNTPTANIGYDSKQNIKQAAAARKIVVGRTRVGGVYAFVNTTLSNQLLTVCLMYAGHQVNRVIDIWRDETPMQMPAGGGTTPVSPYTNIFASYWAGHLGTDDQEADALIVAHPETHSGLWTVNHRLRGIFYVFHTLYFDNNSAGGGHGPNFWTGGVPALTAEIEGALCYDPRIGQTVYTNNSALIVNWYLTTACRYGIGVDYATRINEELLIVAANICDEMVDTLDKDGNTIQEKRYTTNGSWDSDAQPDEILGRLLGAMHGKAIFDGDRWNIYAGAYVEPEFTLTDDMMRAGSTVTTLQSAKGAANAVKGTYVGPDNAYQEADFPAVVSETFKAQDGGIEHFRDIACPFTDTPGRAQRIAKIDLLRARQEITETFRGKLSCWQVRAGDTVYRDSARYGWTQKPFEVNSVKFSVDAGSGDAPVIGIDIELTEIDASVYDWSTDEESAVDPAPNTNFPDPLIVQAPSNLELTESKFVGRTGGAQSRMTLSWDAPLDAFVTQNGAYQARYRLQGADDWIYPHQTIDTTVDIDNVATGTYESQVASINYAGNPSPYYPDPPLVSPVLGLGDVPAAPQNLQFSAGGLGTFAQLRWDKSADLDVLFGGKLYVRHSSLTTGATWDAGVSMTEPMDGTQTQAALPLKTGAYMLKFRDSSGNFSDAAIVYAFQDGSLVFNPLDSVIESPDFAGVLTDCVVGPLGLTIDDNVS